MKIVFLVHFILLFVIYAGMIIKINMENALFRDFQNRFSTVFNMHKEIIVVTVLKDIISFLKPISMGNKSL